VRLVSLDIDRASDTAEIVREYMVATELERGNMGVIERGLPDVLQRECVELLDRFAPPNHCYWLTEGMRSRAVGVKVAGGDAEISRLYVREAHGGTGIANQLMMRLRNTPARRRPGG
jgi:hypothetical protein